MKIYKFQEQTSANTAETSTAIIRAPETSLELRAMGAARVVGGYIRAVFLVRDIERQLSQALVNRSAYRRASCGVLSQFASDELGTVSEVLVYDGYDVESIANVRELWENLAVSYTEDQILAAAEAAHEVNRTYCESLGDGSHLPWSESPKWVRDSVIAGVRNVLSGTSQAREFHESWLRHKREEGWAYGPVKDSVAKTHPCFVPYDDLPVSQQVKDTLFVSTVKGVLSIR